ncbi:hypothetical protein FBU30_005603 [Linnemannia zychae]|nr:hypothetical protein FBU30_005603 [Linnemannia zychae]
MSSILRQNNSCSSPILPDTFVSDQSEVASRIPHPHTNSGGATINTGELPTIMRGLAATHLGTNMLRTPGYQAIGNKGTNNGIQQQQSSTKSENPLKRISRYFKGNSKDKHNITVSSHPVSPPPSSFKFDHNIDTAVARESITPVSLDSSSPVLTMEESGIIDTLVASSVQKDNKPNSIRLDIFSSNLVLNTATNVLPTLHTRINNTVQLVYCCRVLSNSNRPSIASPITENSQEMILTDKEQDWAESMDPVAQNHYHWLVNQLVKMFAEDQLKDQDAIAEIVLVGSILDKSTCRSLLSCFITELENTTLLDLNILQGLIQLVECASDDYLADDDLVRIVTTLFSNLSLTHIGFSNHHLYLTWALCRILDIMVAGKVKDLNRDRDHQPLIQILTSLKDSDNVYLRHQATYAYQALQYLPDDETPLQIIWRYAQGAAQIASAATSILKIDPKGLLEGITALSQI